MRLLNSVKFLVAVCCVAFVSCATIQHREGSVDPSIQNIYLSSVTIKNCKNESFGSGTIIHNRAGEQMFVLTAAHVVKAIHNKGEKVCVPTFFDEDIRHMEVYKIDYERDLALLYTEKNEENSGPSVNISLYGPNIKDHVIVIGAPLGADRTVTDGIISNFTKHKGKVLYRTTAASFFGNSGGGMFNSKGDLIGVCHGGLKFRASMFDTILVPGGAFFVGLETIREFI